MTEQLRAPTPKRLGGVFWGVIFSLENKGGRQSSIWGTRLLRKTQENFSPMKARNFILSLSNTLRRAVLPLSHSELKLSTENRGNGCWGIFFLVQFFPVFFVTSFFCRENCIFFWREEIWKISTGKNWWYKQVGGVIPAVSQGFEMPDTLERESWCFIWKVFI